MQAQIIYHLCLNRFPNLYLQGLPLTLAMKIFSVKVFRFTIQSYRTFDFIRTSNTAQKNRCRREEGKAVPETLYGKILFSAKM